MIPMLKLFIPVVVRHSVTVVVETSKQSSYIVTQTTADKSGLVLMVCGGAVPSNGREQEFLPEKVDFEH